MLSTLLRAWVPSARSLPPALAGVAALVVAPTGVVLLRGGHDHRHALVAAAVVAGAAVAFAVDDPAAETLAASPTPLAARRAVRLSAVLLGVALLAALVVSIAVAGGSVGAGDLARRGAELAAAAGLAAAAAGTADRRRLPSAAIGGAVAGLLGVLLVSAFAYRHDALPALVASPVHARWWLLAGAGWAVAAWSWRDPAR